MRRYMTKWHSRNGASRGPAQRIVLALGLASILTGCASRIQLRSGAAGAPLPAGSAIALIGSVQGSSALTAKAQEAVSTALAKRGHSFSPQAPARLEVGLTSRPASTAVGVIGGETLSPAKAHKFLQSCRDQTYRLTLAYYGAGMDVPITRAWSEEYHCKGTIDASIGELAEKAVDALVKGSSSAVEERAGRQ